MIFSAINNRDSSIQRDHSHLLFAFLTIQQITLLGKYKARLEDKGHVEVTNIKSTLKSKRFIHWTIPCLKTNFAESSRNATTNTGHSHSLNLNIRHSGIRASVCPCRRIPPPLNQDTVSPFYFFKNCLSQLFQCLTTIYSSINRSACCHKLDKQYAPSLSKHRGYKFSRGKNLLFLAFGNPDVALALFRFHILIRNSSVISRDNVL